MSAPAVTPCASRSEVLERLRQHYPDLASQFKVSNLALFGSFAREEQTPASDVDLLVSFQAGRKDFDAYLELVDHLEMLMARRVDLVTTEGLSRHLAVSVLGEALDVALGA